MAHRRSQHDEVLRARWRRCRSGALIEEVIAERGRRSTRRDMSDHRYPEEVTLTSIGAPLRSRIWPPRCLGSV